MSIRTEKVSEEIKHRINEVFSKDLNEPELGLVTVTKVSMSPDLKTAKIYLSFINNKLSPEECIEMIDFRKKVLRKHLASKIYLKAVPYLFFYYDDTIEYASKIDELIKMIHKDDNDTRKVSEN